MCGSDKCYTGQKRQKFCQAELVSIFGSDDTPEVFTHQSETVHIFIYTSLHPSDKKCLANSLMSLP